MINLRVRAALAALGAAALALTTACGGIATPEWAADAQSTRVAQASTSEHLTSIAPTATPTATATATLTPTPIPPTATPSPLPTETAIPPSETPAPPTEAPAADDPIAVALAAGDPANGQVVFNTTYNMPDGSVWMCSQCHSVTPDELRLIGPGMWNIANRAGERVPGEDAVQYIRHSIVAPMDFIVPGDPPYPPLMPAGYETVLTPQELSDVIAYLLTLR
jgi:hypothetical protein